jgi:hypothetical protein
VTDLLAGRIHLTPPQISTFRAGLDAASSHPADRDANRLPYSPNVPTAAGGIAT